MASGQGSTACPFHVRLSPDPAHAQGPSSHGVSWGDRKGNSLEESEATVLMDSSVQGVTFFSVFGYKNTVFIFLNQI